MADPRFFDNQGPFTLAELAECAGAALDDPAQGEKTIRDVAPLSSAGADDISFLDNKIYVPAFKETRAGACLVAPAYRDQAPDGVALLLTDTPYMAYARVAQAFYPRPVPVPGVSPGAHVDPSAVLGDGCAVGAGAVIGPGVEIGPASSVAHNAVVMVNVKIGANAIIGAGASISHALIGDRVTIHPGARIGQDGFGFAPDPAGHVKVPQLGRVVIQDDCEIGANTTIDRGAGPDTVIGAGTWIDNLVQIGHNVQIGRGCILAAMVGISGSCKIGDFVAMGGQVGLAGHLTIGDGAQIAAKAGLMRDVGPGEMVGGIPAVPFKQWLRQSAALARMSKTKGKGNE